MAELLDAMITAHGGLDRWNAVRSVDVTFNFSGGLLDLKGFPGHHRPTASVDVKQPRVVLQRLGGDPDDRWIFTRDRVWIERRDGWSVEERSDPRAAFAGHVRETPWDRLHLTYFLGYALWNYLTAPPIRRRPDHYQSFRKNRPRYRRFARDRPRQRDRSRQDGRPGSRPLRHGPARWSLRSALGQLRKRGTFGSNS